LRFLLVTTLPKPVASSLSLVKAYKRELLHSAMREIILLALDRQCVSPADIPEDTLAKEHRQGVASNAWNALVAEGILVACGRCKNTNPKAKGRWTQSYALKQGHKAEDWLRANKPANAMSQPDLFAQTDRMIKEDM
jgi:hypothetical protein